MTREAWIPGATGLGELNALKRRIAEVERDRYNGDRRQFARKCKLKLSTVKNWFAQDNVLRVPGTVALWKIAKYANVSADWLLLGRGTTMAYPQPSEDAQGQLFRAVRARMRRTHTRHGDPASGEAAELILRAIGPEGLWALAVHHTEDLDQMGGEIRATANML